jgi:hypothetical protein
LTFQAVYDSRGKHDIFEVEYAPAISVLRHTGLRARLDAETAEIFRTGMAYRLAPGTVHRVDAVCRPTATLVLNVLAPGAPAPRVFVPSDSDAPEGFIRDRLDARELKAVRAALSGLRSAPG